MIEIIALTNDSNVSKINNIYILPYFYCILFSVFNQYEIFGRKKELESHNYCHAWLIIAVISECHYSTWSSKRLPADVTFSPKARSLWENEKMATKAQGTEMWDVGYLLHHFNTVIVKLAIAQLLSEPVKRWRANQTFINLSLINKMCISSHFMTKQW